MRLSFFRSFKFQAEVAKAPRLFKFSVGFCGPLDPESGMSVNLVQIDSWIGQAIELVKTGKPHSEDSVLESIALILQELLSSHKTIQLDRIEIQDLVSQKIWMRSALGETQETVQQWVVRNGQVYLLEQWPDSFRLRELVSGDAVLEKGSFVRTKESFW